MKFVYSAIPIEYKDKIEIRNNRLFVSPYKGVASIFIGRSQANEIHKKIKADSFNVEYEEWDDKSCMTQDPLVDVHAYIKGFKFKPFKLKCEGYIYTINYSKYKKYIGALNWQDGSKEMVVSGIDSIEFIKKEKHTINLYVKSA